MRFRLLIDEPGAGALNMAVDETILLSALGPSPIATVRFYGFRPPAVSFGYRQPLSEALDAVACRALGIEWVRRPTGGRALLHHHELTYSIAAPLSGPFQGLSVRGVYHRVNRAIREGLVRLGIPLDPDEPIVERRREPALHVPCLASPSGHEITSGGRKVVASSQRRSRGAFLQHGSILRTVDRRSWEKVRPKSLDPVPLSAAGIDELAREPIGIDRLIAALHAAFQDAFGALPRSEGLTEEENRRVEELLPKYRQGDSPSEHRLIDNSEAVW